MWCVGVILIFFDDLKTFHPLLAFAGNVLYQTQFNSAIGGPVSKVTFFQMVQISLLSVLIYSNRCEYDIPKVLFKKNDQNLSVECVKHLNVPR